jgi:alpha-D-xyloside xylohydrolase
MRLLHSTPRQALTLALASALPAMAAPLATLDRNGAYVSIEAYGPNVVHVTIAADKAEVLKGPGFGILPKNSDNSAFRHSAKADGGGDTFTSAGMTLRVNPAPPPRVPSQGEKYFASSLAPVGLQVSNAKGEQVLSMTGWEMSPHTVNTEKTYQVGASFAAPRDEHFYGMGQNQESLGSWTCAAARSIASTGTTRRTARPSACRSWCRARATASSGTIRRTPMSSGASTAAPCSSRRWASACRSSSSPAAMTRSTPATQADRQDADAAEGRVRLIQSKARYDSQQEVLRVANTYRQKKYPLDVMVLDWFYWTRMGQMDIDPAALPRPGRR